MNRDCQPANCDITPPSQDPPLSPRSVFGVGRAGGRENGGAKEGREDLADVVDGK